jgi:hypothetical protein
MLCASGARRVTGQRLDRRVADRLRVVVHIDRRHIGVQRFQIEPAHQVALPFVQINGAVMHQHLRARLIHLADDPDRAHFVSVSPFALSHTLNHHPIPARAAQAHLPRRMRLAAPEEVLAVPMHLALFRQQSQHVGGVRAGAKALAAMKRQLRGRAAHMIDQQHQVVGVDQRVLRRLLKEKFSVPDHILVEHASGGDEDRDRRVGRAPGAPDLLPRAGDAARIAAEDRRLQPADVDAQLQRVGGDDPAHLRRRAAPPRWRAARPAGSRRDSRAPHPRWPPPARRRSIPARR